MQTKKLINKGIPPSLYVHIPFCERKCKYCAFLSYDKYDPELIDKYVDALKSEIEFRLSLIDGSKIKNCYIGGGTPNVLSIEQLKRIIDLLPKGIEEFSIELNPGLGDLEYIKSLRDLGINRVSVGVQSFNDDNLKMLGRIHDGETAREFLKNISSIFDNFNIDLITALPGQTERVLRSDLESVKEYNPTHISAYILSIDKGTVFEKLHLSGDLKVLSNEEYENLYYKTCKILKSYGYEQYEISNFSKPDFQCKYNLNTWKNGQYLGVGLGAESFVNKYRFRNTSDLKKYLSGNILHSDILNMTPEQDFQIALMLGVRLREGFNYLKYENSLPSLEWEAFNMKLKSAIEDGDIIIENDRIIIPHGKILLSDSIITKLLV